jgi:hypothetical protein
MNIARRRTSSLATGPRGIIVTAGHNIMMNGWFAGKLITTAPTVTSYAEYVDTVLYRDRGADDFKPRQ